MLIYRSNLGPKSLKIDAFLMLLKNELYLELKYNAPHCKK